MANIMLSQMINITRVCRAAQLLVHTQRCLTNVSNTKSPNDNRITGYIRNDGTSVKELVKVYRHLATETSQSSLYSLTEEKLLGLLTKAVDEEDDMVSNYIPRIDPYDYISLCNLFIEIASVKRRPKPLIKAASNALVKLPFLQEYRVPLLIQTLSALVNLNYAHRPLVSKILDDIDKNIEFGELDPSSQNELISSLGNLKWRHEPLMQKYFDHVKSRGSDQTKVSANLIVSLLYISAILNYEPKVDMAGFYKKYIAGSREDSIDKTSKKWLKYVWSLTVLGLAEKHHLESVLNDDYISGIQNPLGFVRFYHSDVMKLLNLRAIARVEMHMLSNKCKILDDLTRQSSLRKREMEKFASRMKNALNGLVNSENCLRLDVLTKHGFVVDCEILLDQNLDFIPLDDGTTLEDELNLAETMTRTCDKNQQKCALIYVLFDETMANYPEPVARKRIIARILKSAGYKTIFLQEAVLAKEQTSSSLSRRIEEIIRKSVQE